jgi:hypothetical protein
MHAYFAMAVGVGLGVATIAGPARDVSLRQTFFVAPQGVVEEAPVPEERQSPEITGSVLKLEPHVVVTRVDGTPLSCEKIRAMDEVELITDDSYCD